MGNLLEVHYYVSLLRRECTPRNNLLGLGKGNNLFKTDSICLYVMPCHYAKFSAANFAESFPVPILGIQLQIKSL